MSQRKTISPTLGYRTEFMNGLYDNTPFVTMYDNIMSDFDRWLMEVGLEYSDYIADSMGEDDELIKVIIYPAFDPETQRAPVKDVKVYLRTKDLNAVNTKAIKKSLNKFRRRLYKKVCEAFDLETPFNQEED